MPLCCNIYSVFNVPHTVNTVHNALKIIIHDVNYMCIVVYFIFYFTNIRKIFEYETV